MGMSANDDGLSPTRDQARNIFANDGLSEYCSSQNVTDGSIGWFPHFFQIELCDKSVSQS